ncbi:MAG: antitoxin [Verrucomicrobiales bacterium]
MVKTQVQIPDTLYREAKRLAAENEMSFAEVVRRGLEEIIRHHPPGRTRAEDWTLPPSFDMGEALAPEEEWTALCHD